jgi:hypothetical protein
MQRLAAALLLVAIIALVGTLALSPYHEVHTAEECRAAYAAARSRVDSIAVSFKPFDDGNRAVDTRCSHVLTVREVSTAQSLIGR